MPQTQYVRYDSASQSIALFNIPYKFQPYYPDLAYELEKRFVGLPITEKLLSDANRFVLQWLYRMMDEID
jgi:hypothetical protein